MKYGELKNQIRDLGFEEDSIIGEYQSIIMNACNRGINIVLKTIVEPHKHYFTSRIPEFKMPTANQIDINTSDDYVIDIPEKVEDLVPLIASHYVWLDDDVTKATYYWNEFDELKTMLMQEFSKSQKAKITGGVRF